MDGSPFVGTQFDLDKLERIPIIFYIHSELLVMDG